LSIVTTVIVVLNGASSAGKTTLARALQDAWDEPALLWGIDTVVAALPRRYLDALWSTEMYRYGYAADGRVTTIEPGPYGDRVVRALHRAVAAAAGSGVHVIVDQVLLTRAWGDDLRSACSGLDLLTVHVYCPPDELERRERARGDRTLGQALAQYRAVAESIGHDLTIDTTETEPELAAERILAAIKGVRTVSPSGR
jgi:chloramphenicol 3-O phosphotransferase